MKRRKSNSLNGERKRFRAASTAYAPMRCEAVILHKILLFDCPLFNELLRRTGKS